MPKSELIVCHADPHLAFLTHQRAQQEGRSVSNLVRRALIAYLASEVDGSGDAPTAKQLAAVGEGASR